MRVVVLCFVLLVAVSASASILHDLDAAKTGNYAPLAARANNSKDPDCGVAARALGNYCLRHGGDAFGWFAVAARSGDPKIASEALCSQANLCVRANDKEAAAYYFKEAAKTANAQADVAEYYYRAGKCYVALAQASGKYPATRIAYKKQARELFDLAGTDAAYVEVLGIRFENILDWEVTPNHPQYLFWELWREDTRKLIERCEDPESKATAQLMLGEILCCKKGGDVFEALQLFRKIDPRHKKQAAWGRIVSGDIYQRWNMHATAIKVLNSIITDFPNEGINFDRNDVKKDAAEMIAISKEEQQKAVAK